MKVSELQLEEVRLEPIFTVDLMMEDDDPQDEMRRYNLALSATGTASVLPDLRVAYSRAIVSGMVSSEDCVGGFVLHPETIKHPSGVTRKQGTMILRKIFEDSGRGAEVDEGWVWRPVQILNFLRKIFDSDTSHHIAAVLCEEVARQNEQDKNENCKG